MASVREEKKALVAELAEKISKARGVYLMDYKGLDVAEMTELRKRCREENIELKVLKNTMLRFAFEENNVEEIKDDLKGPTAVAFSYEDPAAPARVIVKFASSVDKKLPKMKKAYVEGTVYEADKVKNIAKLPPREVLLSQVVAGFQAPISGFVYTLQGILREFVATVDAIREKKQETN